MGRVRRVVAGVIASALLVAVGACAVDPGPSTTTTEPELGADRVSVLLTTGDRRKLLATEPSLVLGSDAPLGEAGAQAVIDIDATRHFQVLDGVGAALTDSAAIAIDGLSPAARTQLIDSLFGPTGARLGYLRVPLSSTDFSTDDHTFDDLDAPGTDEPLDGFDLAPDEALKIPLLQQIAELRPGLQLMGTPWSAPGWMKQGNDRSVRRGLLGGTLDDGAVDVYARYLARVVAGYAAHGLRFDTLTLQNEPGYAPPDYAGMLLSPRQEAQLAVATRAALDADGAEGTRLLGHDHNWDGADRAVELLSEPGAADALSGTAFHCYGGDPAGQAQVHDAFPDEDVYLTECSGTLGSGTFSSNLLWNAEVMIIDGTRNWARSVMLWNLALDQDSGPRVGGCTDCRGVVTIDSRTGAVTRNEEYYALAHLGRGVDQGAHRIASTAPVGATRNVAFENPDGSRTLIVSNHGSSAQDLFVRDGGRTFRYPLPARSVATLRWAAAG